MKERLAHKCHHAVPVRAGRLPNYCDDCLHARENPVVPSHQPWAIRMFGPPRDYKAPK